MLVGYARVSTEDQSLDIQHEKLHAAGCEKVFSEQKSGAAGTSRPELTDCLDFIREGDTLVITRLDRLGRSTTDLFNILERVRARGAAFRCLDQNLDTTTPEGRLLFGLLAVIAEFERDLIKSRQADGIAAAKAAGKYKGGPKAPVDEIVRLAREGWGTGAIAKRLNIHKATVTRHLPEELKQAAPPAFVKHVESVRAKRLAELRPDA